MPRTLVAREGIEFIHEDDDTVTAKDLETSVASFGDTKAEALRMLSLTWPDLCRCSTHNTRRELIGSVSIVTTAITQLDMTLTG